MARALFVCRQNTGCSQMKRGFGRAIRDDIAVRTAALAKELDAAG
jgi:protein-tyrosine-phosphatase